jgi:uncharacterized Ntn-hydrolase superfamily protein
MTFTILARYPKTGSMGIATCTTGRAVGSAVPYAEKGVGIVATQANTNVFHGRNCLNLLRQGFSPERVLTSTLALDPHPEFRQVMIMNHRGESSAHTGKGNSDWCGHEIGPDWIVGGNNITGPQVLEAMKKAYTEDEEKPIQERLIAALDAGEEAGGCNYPDHTAALLVVGIEKELKIYSRPVLDLRVDSSEEPIKELRKMYKEYRSYIEERRKNPFSIKGYR